MLEAVLTEEQKMFRRTLREFTDKDIIPCIDSWEQEKQYPVSFLAKLKELGIMGISIPPEYGGSGGGPLDVVILMEETSRGGTMVVPMTHVGVVSRTITRFGTPGQKEYFLPKLAEGVAIGAYAQTESNAGSDVSSMETTALLSGEMYIINGRKQFISFSDIANLFILIAQTDKSLRGQGIAAFLVEKGTPGFSWPKIEDKMGWHLSATGELLFEDCQIPADNLLVSPGDGFKKLISTFNGERCCNAATCVGIAQGALEKTIKFAGQRIAFGNEIIKYQGIQWMLADMAVDVSAARLLVYNAAYYDDQGRDIAAEAAMAKLFANEMAQRVTNMAIQIHGGFGYMKEAGIERYFRDVRGLAFGGGTPQILRNRVASVMMKTLL